MNDSNTIEARVRRTAATQLGLREDEIKLDSRFVGLIPMPTRSTRSSW